ncbi:uncharacterized protein LOC111704245 isoform X2 [Eurytemora carolleeae]|uniref:uncharacterized protein LOC111704245 isoform X2 n=1 Tax=Eurytemora carolleeae TaxID=1294199 RepID=UPI000C75ECCE|nr:uncharacterized protein LOC111704245 isoform X2 [Eurytemora carolleeae]|eukprot:XP_023332209.1 uncharacterized protein LOC111704245 isoform X2 [Eurytemora affinis]
MVEVWMKTDFTEDGRCVEAGTPVLVLGYGETGSSNYQVLDQDRILEIPKTLFGEYRFPSWFRPEIDRLGAEVQLRRLPPRSFFIRRRGSGRREIKDFSISIKMADRVLHMKINYSENQNWNFNSQNFSSLQALVKTFQSKPLFISNGQGISLDNEADTSIDKTIETANINEDDIYEDPTQPDPLQFIPQVSQIVRVKYDFQSTVEGTIEVQFGERLKIIDVYEEEGWIRILYIIYNSYRVGSGYCI